MGKENHSFPVILINNFKYTSSPKIAYDNRTLLNFFFLLSCLLDFSKIKF